VTGLRIRLLLAVSAGCLVVACGKQVEDISGTYVEMESFGAPGTIELRPDGTGAYIVNLGGRNIEDPFDWAASTDDSFVLNYPSGAVERFTFEGGELVFMTADGTVRYADPGGQEIAPVEGSDVPFSIFQ